MFEMPITGNFIVDLLFSFILGATGLALFLIVKIGVRNYIKCGSIRVTKEGNPGHNPGSTDSLSIGDLENPESLVTVKLMTNKTKAIESRLQEGESRLDEGAERFRVIDGKLNTICRQGNRLVRAFYALKAVSETVKEEEPPELNNFDDFES